MVGRQPRLKAPRVAITGVVVPTFRCKSISSEGVAEYWSEERLASVKPFPFDPADSLLDAGATERASETAESLFLPSGGPQPTGAEIDHRADSPVQEAPNPPWNSVPFWNCGLFVATDEAKQLNYAGTAAFVAGPNILMTAAHNVISRSTGAWFDKFVFYRAFKGGSWAQAVEPQEICIYKDVFENARWDARYDYAFISTKQASSAGWLGFQWNPELLQATAVGYPACIGGNPKLPNCVGGQKTDGQTMYYVAGNYVPVEGLGRLSENSMQHGASGGPWIAKFSTTTSAEGRNLAMGLTSFNPGPNPAQAYSPYFDVQTYNLLCRVYRGTNDPVPEPQRVT